MDNIYILTDTAILAKIGEKLKSIRLKQNITQQSLAETAGVSLTSLKNIEKGEIRSFDSLLRVLRTLGKLDVLLPLVEEQQMSPSEYYEMVHAANAHQRKRAVGKLDKGNKEDAGW